MNRRKAEKLGRSILHREGLVEKLPALRAEVAGEMDAEGYPVVVGDTVKIIRDEGGIRVTLLPQVDPRQMKLWEDEDDDDWS